MSHHDGSRAEEQALQCTAGDAELGHGGHVAFGQGAQPEVELQEVELERMAADHAEEPRVASSQPRARVPQENCSDERDEYDVRMDGIVSDAVGHAEREVRVHAEDDGEDAGATEYPRQRVVAVEVLLDVRACLGEQAAHERAVHVELRAEPPLVHAVLVEDERAHPAEEGVKERARVPDERRREDDDGVALPRRREDRVGHVQKDDDAGPQRVHRADVVEHVGLLGKGGGLGEGDDSF